MREDPGHRHPRERDSRRGRQRAEGFHRRELTLVPVALRVAAGRGAEREAGPGGRARLVTVLAGEQAAGERVVRDHAEPVRLAERQQFALDLAKEQVVARLHGVKARHAQDLAPAQRARHPPGGEVRATDVARLARAHDVVERAQGLVDRRLRVWVVQLVEVDVVATEPPERPVDGVEDVLA